LFHLTVEKSFAAAHQLHAHKGKCKNLHGHTFKVRVTVAGESLDPEQGFLVDFGDIKKELNAILEEFDHKNLNDLSCFQGRPTTSEAIAQVIYSIMKKNMMKENIASLSSVTVYESESAWVTYSE
jgi:6-pyruvoyltetrahydropterin/6-carboxytetrahydropterin synthase